MATITIGSLSETTSFSLGTFFEIQAATSKKVSGATAQKMMSGLVLVEEHIASNSATLDFTTGISATYDEYELRINNVVPATNDTNLTLLVSTDRGSNWSGSGYSWVIMDAGDATNPEKSGNTSTSSWKTLTACSNTSGHSASCKIILPNLTSASLHKSMYWTGMEIYSVGPQIFTLSGAGRWATTTAVNALRIQMSAGNITSGIARLYGFAKA